MFDTESDFSEAHDVAGMHPGVTRKMKDLWRHEWLRHVGRPLTQPAPNICRLNEKYNQPMMRIPDR